MCTCSLSSNRMAGEPARITDGFEAARGILDMARRSSEASKFRCIILSSGLSLDKEREAFRWIRTFHADVRMR